MKNPKIIILLLILFFPVGLYFMWKNELWNKKLRVIITSGFVVLWIIGSLLSPSENNNDSSSPYSRDGVYTYINGDIEWEIVVSGDEWSGEWNLCDVCDKEYPSGIIRDNQLYDDSGFVMIGVFNEPYITIGYQGSSVTLKK